MSAELALLCCIPLEESEWLQRFESREYGDFVRSNTEEKFKGDPHQTWRMFSREALFIQRKLDALARKQVEVVLRAETTHIQDAAARYSNVVILAHWKHERVLRSDILSPALLWQQMLSVDPNLHRLGVSTRATSQFEEQLRSTLDHLVVHGGSNLVTIPASLGNGRLPASVLRREVLNAIPFLVAGNRLELWDAMVSAEEFSKLFGREFAGTALMAICNSVLLAETFRFHHPKAICICNGDTTNAGLNLTKLDAAVMLMGAKRIALWQALNQVGDIMDSLAT